MSIFINSKEGVLRARQRETGVFYLVFSQMSNLNHGGTFILTGSKLSCT